MPGYEFIGVEEKEAIASIMDTGVFFRFGFDAKRRDIWMASEFESLVGKQCARAHCHALSSGTAALITALTAAGIGAGDEVIVPPFTFVATVEAVLQVGAVPVFCAVDESLGVDAASLAEVISPATKAVILVHMCGVPASIAEVSRVCSSNNLLLIEDACQALGATMDDRPVGSFGDISCISFDYVKIVTCGEGGAVLSDSEELIRACREYSDHGHDYQGRNRGLDGHCRPGVNFRISELHAAVGVGQIRKFATILARHRKLARLLADDLKEANSLKVVGADRAVADNGMFVNVLLNDGPAATKFVKSIESAGLTAAYWYANNWHYIRQWKHFGPFGNNGLQMAPEHRRRSDLVMERLVSVPVSTGWSDADIANARTALSTAARLAA